MLNAFEEEISFPLKVEVTPGETMQLHMIDETTPVRGVLIDGVTGRPVAGAEVVFRRYGDTEDDYIGSLERTTELYGSFSFNGFDRRFHTLVVRAPQSTHGDLIQPMKLTRGNPTVLEIRLAPYGQLEIEGPSTETPTFDAYAKQLDLPWLSRRFTRWDAESPLRTGQIPPGRSETVVFKKPDATEEGATGDYQRVGVVSVPLRQTTRNLLMESP